MRAVVQRVSQARVLVEARVVAAIERGLLVLLGVAKGDDEARAKALAEKLVSLRLFADDAGRTNLGLAEIGGAILVVSQFTLFADVRRGRRPYFGDAEAPDRARSLCAHFSAVLRGTGVPVFEGEFGAMMQVELTNDGPVTLVIDSADLETPRRAGSG
ncbi:MAG: D-tyrosyl-tRNA(Tyr) deacylase [Deltaproteobacteria bacterium]|nr:D-tyrosyl-tRNA(Tyr) deacylase [Deltaproteobacteria bacterium]